MSIASNIKPDLSIVLPCYNEADNIPFIFEQFISAIGDADFLEIILVNNGSTDNSEEIFEQELLKNNDSRFKVVKVEKNQGYGFGILFGLEKAEGKILAFTHADLQTPPKDVLTAYHLFKNKMNPMLVVKGRRKNRAIIPAFFTWGMQVISSIALKVNLKDIAGQPKVFSRYFYTYYLLNKAPHDFSLDLFLMYWVVKEGKVIETPVYFEKRLHGEAKGGGSLKTRIKVTKRTWDYIFELRKKIKSKK